MTLRRIRRSLLRREDGQATVFMAIFITSMILVFAFATNIGMLVHAKINLQNAADAAAYAGAAVQARQMTAIAYLNWEMRRSVKQFMFNWMVRGNLAQSCFPANSNGTTLPGTEGFCSPIQAGRTSKYKFSFFDPREGLSNEPADEYLPTTCIIFDPSNNYCQKTTVAGIPELGGIGGVLTFVNPIIQQVKRSTQIIIQKKIEDCVARGNGNLLMLFAWLFNLDTNPLPVNIQADVDTAFPITGSIDSLGVLPRQALLRARMENLEEALNLNLKSENVLSNSTVTDDALRTLLADESRRDYYERPIQAFLSAKNNLPSKDEDNGIFSDVQLTELIPFQSPATRNPNLQNEPVLFKLNDITDDVKVAASKFYQDIDLTGARGACTQKRVEMRIPSFPLGVTKDPRILTYYAVNLKANVRLLFSPFGADGTVTLGAYSAAMPFGSRIGKNLLENPDQFMHSSGKRVHTDVLVGEFRKQHQFVNLLVSDDDRNALQDGFASTGNLGYLRRAIRPVLGMPKAFRLAGAYSPWEIGYYTIPANFAGISQFPNNPDFVAKNGYFELKVPVAPWKQSGSDIGFLLNRIRAMFTTAGFLNAGEDSTELDVLMDSYLAPSNFTLLEGFLRTLGQDQAHFIPDPILLDDPQTLNYALSEGRKYTVAGRPEGQRRQLTSWNNQKSANQVDRQSELGPQMGRSGYSVRFVSFHSLIQGGLASNDGGINWDDPFARIEPEGADAQRILDEIRALRH